MVWYVDAGVAAAAWLYTGTPTQRKNGYRCVLSRQHRLPLQMVCNSCWRASRDFETNCRPKAIVNQAFPCRERILPKLFLMRSGTVPAIGGIIGPCGFRAQETDTRALFTARSCYCL